MEWTNGSIWFCVAGMLSAGVAEDGSAAREMLRLENIFCVLPEMADSHSAPAADLLGINLGGIACGSYGPNTALRRVSDATLLKHNVNCILIRIRGRC